MKKTKKNEGVALIVVLGFLSLMLVMAVAFLGEARTERLVSDYSLEAIRSRQLMRTALAAAQNDYSEALWDTRKALPDADWEVFTSEASGVDAISGKQGTLGGSGVVITNGEIMEWIPARYKTKDVMDEMEDAEWILVREEPGKNSRILGRYAYICLDSSGGLDANWVMRNEKAMDQPSPDMDGKLPLKLGHSSITNVALHLLPEVSDPLQFFSYRKGWKGFDSLQTLVKLTDGVPNDGTDSKTNTRWQKDREEKNEALAPDLVSDLVTYSLTAYRGGRYHRGSGEWDKPNYMDPATGAGWKAVLAPLQGQGWSESDLEKQLQDYLKPSRTPQGVDYPSIEAVPMFNELWVELEKFEKEGPLPVEGLDSPSYTYKVKLKVGIETWFPFPSKDNDGGSYTLEAPTLCMQSSKSSGQILIPVRLKANGGYVNVKQADLKIPPEKTFVASYGNPQAHVFEYTLRLIPLETVTDDQATLQWGARGMVWQVTSDIDLKSGGTTVDRLPQNIQGEGSAPPIGHNGSAGPFSMEVTDPRLNHIAKEWQQPDRDEGTPGKINSVTEKLPDFQKEGEWMYCRNGKMESLTEFGFFSTGKPWKTLDLCTEEGKEFLALGTLDKAVKDDLASKGVHYTNGTININTYRTNVLASAFYLVPFLVPPMDASSIAKTNAFTADQARRFAQLIQQETASEPYQSGLDWANTPAMRDGGYLESQGLTRTERESILRNTDGLFSVSDSLFTVILIAQSVKEGPGNVGQWDDEDQVTGERRGVALVWRDPFKTGNNLHHEMMVRMFRFLND